MTTHTDGSTVTHDLYKDIHKAIRAELFGVTVAAGSLDPSADGERSALATRIGDLVQLLVGHAEHEEAHMQDLLVAHVPRLAHQIEAEHVTLDRRMLDLSTLAAAAAEARSGEPARRRLHGLYLELASFASAYLAHQDVEERLVMPALSAAVPVEVLLARHDAIVSSIPPQEMAASLAIMLPAQNADDRAELLGGMQAGAPAEVFAGVVGLAQAVLAPQEFATLSTRLGLAAAV